MDRDPASQGVALEARGISFSYSKRAEKVLDGWSEFFAAGTSTALTGASGRGKSTLLYLLGLMLTPTTGEVWVDGVPVARLTDRQRSHLRATRYGFVFQDAALDASRSVLDNVTETALYNGADRAVVAARARDLLGKFDVDVPATRKPGQVSGGQAQRIALCRALVNDPDIVLADEPTGNLDPDSAQIVVDGLIDHARSGGTVIIVTHSPNVAAACDREVRL